MIFALGKVVNLASVAKISNFLTNQQGYLVGQHSFAIKDTYIIQLSGKTFGKSDAEIKLSKN